MTTKIFCDECGKEITDGVRRMIVLRNDGDAGSVLLSNDLCEDCYMDAYLSREWSG